MVGAILWLVACGATGVAPVDSPTTLTPAEGTPTEAVKPSDAGVPAAPTVLRVVWDRNEKNGCTRYSLDPAHTDATPAAKVIHPGECDEAGDFWAGRVEGSLGVVHGEIPRLWTWDHGVARDIGVPPIGKVVAALRAADGKAYAVTEGGGRPDDPGNPKAITFNGVGWTIPEGDGTGVLLVTWVHEDTGWRVVESTGARDFQRPVVLTGLGTWTGLQPPPPASRRFSGPDEAKEIEATFPWRHEFNDGYVIDESDDGDVAWRVVDNAITLRTGPGVAVRVDGVWRDLTRAMGLGESIKVDRFGTWMMVGDATGARLVDTVTGDITWKTNDHPAHLAMIAE